MDPEFVNNWIASFALLISAIALGVAIYNVMLNRPRLRLNGRANMLVLSGDKKDGPFLSITVTNVGTQPTTVTSIGLTGYDHAWTPKFGSRGKHCVLNGGGYSTPLPKALGPGEFLNFFADETDEIWDSFLNKPACYIVVSHSWKSVPEMKRIKLAKGQS